jgi:hypothetical protein
MGSKYLWSFFLFIELAGIPVFGGQLQTFEVRAGGLARTYIVYKPDNLNRPARVVFAFHGGGGTAGGIYLSPISILLLTLMVSSSFSPEAIIVLSTAESVSLEKRSSFQLPKQQHDHHAPHGEQCISNCEANSKPECRYATLRCVLND